MNANFPADVIAQVRDATKAHLRAAGAAEDALIAQYAASALALCEAFTGRSLILREHTATLAARGGWQRLELAPVAAVTRVEALADDGVALALPAHLHAVDIDGNGEGWVRILPESTARRVRVAYEAGLAADWAGLPAALAQGIVLLAAHLGGGATGAPPAAVTALWRPWRRVQLAAEHRA